MALQLQIQFDDYIRVQRIEFTKLINIIISCVTALNSIQINRICMETFCTFDKNTKQTNN